MADTEREAFEAWAASNKYRLDMWKHPPSYKESSTFHAHKGWQATTQRQQERIAQLQAEVGKLTTALLDCREAFPIPDQGSTLEPAWMGAMAEPDAVPAYVKAQVQALAPDAARYQAFFDADWPIKFLGASYYSKPELDAAIDAIIAASKEQA